MIVCICNNVNSDSIHASIDNGACSVDAIRNETGAASCCGKCQFKVNRILQERQQADAAYMNNAVEVAFS